jgi:hypothetical protein
MRVERRGSAPPLRDVLNLAESVATLKVGIGCEFEPKVGPCGAHATQITVTLIEALSVL